MDTQQFYITDFYSLKKSEEDRLFIAKLNNEVLIKLVTPTLELVTDYLHSLVKNDTSQTFPEIRDGEIIEKKLAEILSSEHLLEKKIDPQISLFSSSFFTLRNRILKKSNSGGENGQLQISISNWLEDNLAKVISKDDRFCSYRMISGLMSRVEMLHFFYDSLIYHLPIACIINDMGSWKYVSEDNFNDKITVFGNDNFETYEERLNDIKESSPWKYILESTKASNYAILNHEYSFKSAALLVKDISIWLKFWDNLKLPLLQYLPFHTIRNPHSILKIANELVKQKNDLTSDSKHLAFILLKSFFENSLRVNENLSFYEKKEEILSSNFASNHKIIEVGKRLVSNWSEEKQGLYREIIGALLDLVTIEEMSEWVFSYKPKVSSNGAFRTPYNTEVEILNQVFAEYLNQSPLVDQIQSAKGKFNLQRFHSIALQIKADSNSQLAAPLLETLVAYIESEEFIWDQTFSPAYWPALKEMGRLLSLTQSPAKNGKEFVSRAKINHEGWNVASITDSKRIDKELFIYCGAILLLEHDIFIDKKERGTYLNYLLEELISQSRFSLMKTNSYKLPLYLLKLVVNQIYVDLKEHFEIKVIREIDDIVSIIEIFYSDGYKLSERARILFQKRRIKEYTFKHQKFILRGQFFEVEKFQKAITELELEE